MNMRKLSSTVFDKFVYGSLSVAVYTLVVGCCLRHRVHDRLLDNAVTGRDVVDAVTSTPLEHSADHVRLGWRQRLSGVRRPIRRLTRLHLTAHRL